MNKPVVTMGIDVSKDTLDISLHNKSYQYTNGSTAIAKLIKFAKTKNVGRIVCEATGGYEINLIILCNKHNMMVCRVNPRQVRDFAKASGVLAKTDKIDAKIIVSFANIFDLYPTDISESIELAQLAKHRENLVKERSNNLKRSKKLSCDFVKKSIASIMHLLNEEISQCDQQIQALINADSSLKEKSDIMTSVKGVGATTAAAMLLAFMPEIGNVENSKVAALAGLAPYNRDSGKMTGKRSVKAGRKSVRNTLYMAAVVAIRFNKKMKAFYDRLIQQKKPYKVAITAVMRKLLITLNAMIKSNKKWEEKTA